MVALVLVLFSYLLGSIPSAYIAGRAAKGIDIRKVGDGNVGAANAYREIGSKSGMAVLVADVGKGAIAVSITSILASQPVVLLAGLGAVVGHNWPLYIGFRGGRGESTAIGVLSVLLPQAMLILLAISAVPFFVTRNTMLVGAILFSPLWLVALLTGASAALVGYSIGLPCLVGLTHFVTTRHLPDETRHTAQYMQ